MTPDEQSLIGIFATFAAGNDGWDSATMKAPASYPATFSVGTVTADDTIANFSSRIPSTWFGSNLVKPEVSAPGVKVRSSMPGGAYGEIDGTSMAAPHVTGAVALMLQANPGLTVAQLESVIKQTAKPLGSTTPNNDYGWGRIDAYAAVARDAHINTHAASHSAGTTFSNQSASGYPIVDVEGTPITVTADADGYYTAYLPAGSYTLTVSSPGYRIATASEVPIIAQGTTVRNFDLAPVPTILLVDSGAWYYDSQSLCRLPSVVK